MLLRCWVQSFWCGRILVFVKRAFELAKGKTLYTHRKFYRVHELTAEGAALARKLRRKRDLQGSGAIFFYSPYYKETTMKFSGSV
jgi:hypothetical protein